MQGYKTTSLTSSSNNCRQFSPSTLGHSRSYHNKNSVLIRASTQQNTAATTSQAQITDKPQWTGDSLLSQVVNAAINFPPLFGIMKIGARAAIKGTAEKRGVPWAENVSTLENSEVYKIKKDIENTSMTYPSYYVQPFHGYDQGNLNWQAAFEVEPATEAMALRIWKQETELTPLQAQTRLRQNIFNDITSFMKCHSLQEEGPKDILDIGCSVGVSTKWVAEKWPRAQVTGLDLSPYFLAVAELRERQYWASLPTEIHREESKKDSAAQHRQRISYIHANMECTDLPDNSYDLITIQFVIHECPAQVISNVINESKRLLRPGGVLAFTDNNPASKIIQGLPPVLFTLMKSTEPWSDEYFSFDVEAAMCAAGFEGVVTTESDPRHRTVTGYIP